MRGGAALEPHASNSSKYLLIYDIIIINIFKKLSVGNRYLISAACRINKLNILIAPH